MLATHLGVKDTIQSLYTMWNPMQKPLTGVLFFHGVKEKNHTYQPNVRG